MKINWPYSGSNRQLLIIPQGLSSFFFLRRCTKAEISGKIFKRVKLWSPFTTLKHGQQLIFSQCNRSMTIRYVDSKATERIIKVPERSGGYFYEGLTTWYIYELFVRTSLFSQVFGSFPQQHVAFTEENIDLPPLTQPWFFGAISDEETEAILSSKQRSKANNKILFYFSRTKN